ncbi:MAG: hypothetical protein GY884_08040, partial [Proteobacteria bacterium]|nr:hypothetical protein [Pseudomonadota bacterium]
MLAPSSLLAAFAAALALVLAAPQDAEPDYDKLVDGRALRIERHDAFRTIEFERLTGADGLELYVQRIPRTNPERAQELLAWYEDLARKVGTRLDREVLGPSGIEEVRPRRPVAIVVLASVGDWTNYANHAEKACGSGYGGVFDEVFGAVVALDPAAIQSKPKDGLTHSFCHAYVHAVLQAHAGCTDRS